MHNIIGKLIFVKIFETNTLKTMKSIILCMHNINLKLSKYQIIKGFRLIE